MDLVIFNRVNQAVVDVMRDHVTTTSDPFNGTLNPELTYIIVDSAPEGIANMSELDSSSVELRRTDKLNEIDTKTGEVILRGFTYDSVQFSLSLEAQSNFQGMKMAAADGLLTYPVEVSTLDNVNGAKYDLADASAVTAFYLTGMTAVQAALAGGRALKIAVRAATTIAEIEAIVDNR